MEPLVRAKQEREECKQEGGNSGVWDGERRGDDGHLDGMSFTGIL